MLKRWRRMQRSSRNGQALVEFSMVLMLIMSTMVGGVMVIEALFLEERLIDITARAAEWGASTNSNEQIQQITDETSTFSRDVTITLNPPDAKNRPIGSKFTIAIVARIPMLGPGIAFTAPLGASTTVLIEHNPMRFGIPIPPDFRFHYGDYVRVRTTAHESLNVRRTPGIKGATFFSLYNGDYAIIVGGPVEANGLRWWQVYATRSKLTGWCVDQADTVQTLNLITKFF